MGRIGELYQQRGGTKLIDTWVDGYEMLSLKNKLSSIKNDIENIEQQKKNLKGNKKSKKEITVNLNIYK